MRMTMTALTIALCLGATAVPATAADPTTEDQKTFYALGLAMSQNLGGFALTEAEFEFVKAGLSDGILKRQQKVDLQIYGPRIQQLKQARMAAGAGAEKKVGAAFLAKAASEPGATKGETGYVIKTIKPGTGASPKASDSVKVHYHGTLIDGTVFDSSIQRNEPATFPLGDVIPCWTQAVQKMKVGGKSRLVCPSDLAYGDRGAPPQIKPGATLVFEVELLEIVKP
ncbi:MAG: FKBP-type peptidyl-prolyl cis-trans isomerase [Nitrospirae bacterium]|nr:FKBP-type peptidyl-prolyl cis-trans isomerase [Nitrospirota bacterium]